MLQTQTVTPETLALIKRLMADTRLADFTLVGGTALALTIGHRKSIDIDLFIDRAFDAPKIAETLKNDYEAEYIQSNPGSITCFIEGIKTDLIAHPYAVVENPSTIDGIRIMSLPDIAAMKLHAIVNNGTRLKDFIDIHFLLEEMPLFSMYHAYETKYYPNTSRDIVKLALRDHSGINFKEPVQLFNRKVEWPTIDYRQLAAMENPLKVFDGPKNKIDLSQKPKQKRGRRI